MLATLVDVPPSGPQWSFERKLDGERCLAARTDGRVRLLSRTDRDLTATYPEVATGLLAQRPRRLTIDGEIVAFAGQATSFARLQRRLGVTAPGAELLAAVPVVLCAFDLLQLEGKDLRPRPLAERQAALRAAIVPGPALQPVAGRTSDDPQRLLAEACAAGWEGLVAKRLDAPYTPGRSRAWQKVKCRHEQEFVIGGWTDPTGSRIGFGALLVGYHQDGDLRYAGKVGTGFDQRTLRDLGKRLRALTRPDSPFAEPIRPIPPGTHWVQPELVAQIAFAEWTTAGRLRQPRFLGLRDDKPAADVVRET